MLIRALVEWQEEMTGWRRHLHQHPETAFAEFATAKFVAEKLSSFGIEVYQGLAGTGVVGVLRRGTESVLPAIGLRADMDALLIQEENQFEHQSVFPGKMHACGHDGHTTMLLAAARYLAMTRQFRGTVYFIFQPAEENEGGGRRMVEEGLFERFPMNAVFGLHNIPGMALGQFAAMAGPMMASFDTFEITIRGVGAHAAMPHTGIDSILIGSQLALALNTVVSRNVDPLEAAVLSVTQFRAGDTWNVSPQTAVLRGTVRTFSETVRTSIERRIHELASQIARSYGGGAEVFYDRRYPATVNDPVRAQQSRDVIVTAFGADRLLVNARPIMAGEDFAFMLAAKEGSYVWLGTGSETANCTLHHPNYDFNDAALPFGATYWVRLVEKLLPESV